MIRARRLYLVGVSGLLAAVSSACTTRATTTAMAASSANSPTSVVSGVSIVPNLVNVVPFELVHGNVNVQAALDGRRGTYTFDTGSEQFWLNPDYVRPSPTGGLDTVKAGDPHKQGDVTIHTMQIGTFLEHVDSIDVGPPEPSAANASVQASATFNEYGDHELGTISQNGMEPFETIIDYPNRRVIMIRLDKGGHRMVEVPAYTPVATLPLVPAQYRVANLGMLATAYSFWGVVGVEGDTMIVDTGDPLEDADSLAQRHAGVQLRQAIKVGTVSPTAKIEIRTHRGIIGYNFLRELGVVGFNFRTHQLVLYKQEH